MTFHWRRCTQDRLTEAHHSWWPATWTWSWRVWRCHWSPGSGESAGCRPRWWPPPPGTVGSWWAGSSSSNSNTTRAVLHDGSGNAASTERQDRHDHTSVFSGLNFLHCGRRVTSANWLLFHVTYRERQRLPLFFNPFDGVSHLNDKTCCHPRAADSAEEAALTIGRMFPYLTVVNRVDQENIKSLRRERDSLELKEAWWRAYSIMQLLLTPLLLLGLIFHFIIDAKHDLNAK